MTPEDEKSLLGMVADIRRSVDPSIATRMAVAEERLDGVEERQRNSVKWLRRQLGVIIGGATAILGKWLLRG